MYRYKKAYYPKHALTVLFLSFIWTHTNNGMQEYKVKPSKIADVFTSNTNEKEECLLTSILTANRITATLTISYENGSYLSLMSNIKRSQIDTFIPEFQNYLEDLKLDITLPIESSTLKVFIPTIECQEEYGGFKPVASSEDIELYQKISAIYTQLYKTKNSSHNHPCYYHKNWKPTINLLHTNNSQLWVSYGKKKEKS